MGAIFLPKWGKLAASQLSRRNFERWCAMFVKVACGMEISEEDRQTKAYILFKNMEIEEEIQKFLKNYERKVEYNKRKLEQNEKKNNALIAENQTDNSGKDKDKYKDRNKDKDIDKDINKDIDIDNNISKEKSKKEKDNHPTIEEVIEHVKEKNYTFDAEAFFNYYESNGWKVGKNPMKSWRAACVTWQKKQIEYNQNNYNNGRTNNNNNGIPKFNDGFSGNYPPEQETIHLD